MSVSIIYRVSDRAVLVINPERDKDGAVVLPIGVLCATAEIGDVEAQKFNLPNGGFVLNQDGATLQVLAVPALSPLEIELNTAKSDLVTQYQAAMDRLTQIQNATNPTNAQVVAAVQDIATIEKRILRLLAALLT